MLRPQIVKQLSVNFGGAALASVGTTVSASASFVGMTSSDGIAVNAVPDLSSQIPGPTFIIIKEVIPATDSFTVILYASGAAGTAGNIAFNVTRLPAK